MYTYIIVMCCSYLSCSKMEKTTLLIIAVILCLLQVCVTHVAAGESIPPPGGKPQPILEYG